MRPPARLVAEGAHQRGLVIVGRGTQNIVFGRCKKVPPVTPKLTSNPGDHHVGHWRNVFQYYGLRCPLL